MYIFCREISFRELSAIVPKAKGVLLKGKIDGVAAARRGQNNILRQFIGRGPQTDKCRRPWV
jgi:hypothetical protein